jgi:hypothetical protein
MCRNPTVLRTLFEVGRNFLSAARVVRPRCGFGAAGRRNPLGWPGPCSAPNVPHFTRGSKMGQLQHSLAEEWSNISADMAKVVIGLALL